MDISALGGEDLSWYHVAQNHEVGNDGAQIDQIFKKIMERKDANGDGALDQSEFKIPEDKFLKVDSDDNGLLSEEELKAGIMEKIGKLKALMSGYEHMQAAQKDKPESLLDFLKIEIPGNGIDDDGDGEIDEDDSVSLLDVLNDDEKNEGDDTSSLFDLLM